METNDEQSAGMIYYFSRTGQMNRMMRMKRLILLLVFFTGLQVFAQKSKPRNLPIFDKKQFHFGYSVGINMMDYTVLTNDEETLLGSIERKNVGININLITSYRLGEYFNLRFLPGLSFGQRDLSLWDRDLNEKKEINIESIFIETPILVKYRAKRVNNYAPYLVSGANMRFDLVGSEMVDWKPGKRLSQVFDVYYELGVGCDFYMPVAKIATELKFSVGLLNLFKDPAPDYLLYSRTIDRLLSKIVVFSIHIE